MLSKNFKIFIIIVVLIVIIGFSLIFSCSDIVPYSPNNNWYYKYEGMKDISGNKMDISGNKMDLSGNGVVGSINAALQAAQQTITQNPVEHLTKKTKTQGTVEGFEGIFGTPVNTNEIIDVFSNTKSSVNCYGSGLTNSGGGLCLNEKQKHLLTTRGGNASGASSS